MIEKVVLDYLRDILEVWVDVEVPEKEPDEYVIIEKIGSSEENFVFSATFALKSHARSLYAAAELNEKVKAAMDSIIALDNISIASLRLILL